jgi:hypothetical protein
VFSNRAYFLFDKLPGELAVQNVKDSDTGKLKFSLTQIEIHCKKQIFIRKMQNAN